MTGIRKSSMVALAILCFVATCGCSDAGSRSTGGPSMACDYRTPGDLARGATSLVLLTAIDRGTAKSGGEVVAVASVHLDRVIAGAPPEASFMVVNPDLIDVQGKSTLRKGAQYLAYLRPWVDTVGSEAKGVWLTVGGPEGLWGKASSGSFESLWADPAMPVVTDGELDRLPVPSRTVAQVIESPASCA